MWSIQRALERVNTNFLLVHGEKDEAVPLEHSQTLNEWIKTYVNKNYFLMRHIPTIPSILSKDLQMN